MPNVEVKFTSSEISNLCRTVRLSVYEGKSLYDKIGDPESNTMFLFGLAELEKNLKEFELNGSESALVLLSSQYLLLQSSLHIIRDILEYRKSKVG